MRFLVGALILLVGTCSNKRHSERVSDLKESIKYENKADVTTYLNTIKEDELKQHLVEIASEKYMGRKTGEKGHNDVCDYIRNYYKSINLKSPDTSLNYYQVIPKSYLPDGIKASQNIIAYIEGNEFPNEYVYILAHTDHEGVINNEVYYGADDNGSGNAAILEIAEAFMIAYNNGDGPKRSIVFLNVTAEEIGLYGSRYYTENPIFPIEKTVGALNMDMIGRIDERHKENPDYIYVIGSDRISTELDYVIRKANDEFTNLELDYKYNDRRDSNRYYNRSDHYNFALKDIPVVFFFNGEHEDYTKPTDTADKINFSLLAKRTKLIFASAWYIANSTEPITKEVL